MMLHRFPEAIECLGEISTDAPKEILENVYINMGKTYFYLDNMDMASFWLRKHRYLNPHSSSARELEHMIEKRTDELRLEYMNNHYHELRKVPEMICPKCGKQFKTNGYAYSTEGKCPHCKQKIFSPDSPKKTLRKEMICPKCGKQFKTNGYAYSTEGKCPHCKQKI